MKHLKFGTTVAVLSLLTAVAFAGNGTAQLSFYPAIAVADARTQITVTCEVRDLTGRVVPDGTQVLFSTTLGLFTEPLVKTTAGIARAVLTASQQPGFARITASVQSVATNVSIDYEFVKDRAELNNLQDFIEIRANKKINYAMSPRIISAAAPDRGAKVSFRNITISADDLQLTVPTYEVRARNALLTGYGKELVCDELYYSLNRKSGYALTTVESERQRWKGGFPSGTVVTEKRKTKAIVELKGVEPSLLTHAIGTEQFKLADTSNLGMDVRAKGAIVWPLRQIYFQDAEVSVEGTRIYKAPLLKVGTQPNSPPLGEQLLSVSNSAVTLSYPYYLSLKPHTSSLVRLRSGLKSSTGAGAGGGNFLDYELRWNKGSASDGMINIRGLARNDWSAGFQQFLRLDDQTSLYAYADTPSHKSVFGSFQVSRQMGRLNLNYSANASRSLRGSGFGSATHTLALENLPKQLGRSPFSLTTGLTAQHFDTRAGTVSNFSSNVGLRARINSNSIPIGRGSSIFTALSVTQRFARNSSQGTGLQSTTSLSQALGSSGNIYLTYDYLDDKVNSFALGRHQLSSTVSYYRGRFNANLYGGKTLDANRYNLSATMDYNVSSLWRLTGIHSLDRFQSNYFSESSFIVGYRIGDKEVGVSWSSRTKRIGLELLGIAL